jgi:hypothetical protein
MKGRARLWLSIISVGIVLTATVLTAFASAPDTRKAEINSSLLQSSAPDAARSAAKGCTKIQASDPSLWYETDTDGNVNEQNTVELYPTGTNTIAAGFEYNCIPSKLTLTVIYYFGGTDTEPVFTDKEAVKADSQTGSFYWSIGTKDQSALPEGDWQVQWYGNKQLISSGEVMVGEQDGKKEVTVQGTITDGKTKKPIKSAGFFILNPGVTAEDWANNDFAETDVYSFGQGDAKGKFVCDKKIARNETYAVIAVAKGYKSSSQDDFMVDDQQPDPVNLTIKLYK